MVSATASMEFITTHTEAEALLLESNLIKKLKPRYNILLRDDKSFPYILITGDHAWPQITKHRGARNRQGRYFGPFASAGAVNETINALQKAFPLRNCSDGIFASRTRPCLQYQIKRCTAPCVGRISAQDYGAIVEQAFTFLAGKSHAIQEGFSARMQAASADMDFEAAAIYRDRIRALTQIQSRQGINNPGIGDADVIAVHREARQTCVQVFFFRAGQNFGNRAHYPAHAGESTPAEVAAAFLGQFYATNPPPRQILLSHEIEHHGLIEEALSLRAQRRVTLLVPKRGKKRDLVKRALANAAQALDRRLAESASQRRLLEGVAAAFALETPPGRIEVYDNSHISGTDAVGSMIVAGAEGLARNQYRKFNIRGTELSPGDDFAMMREVLGRRFAACSGKTRREKRAPGPISFSLTAAPANYQWRWRFSPIWGSPASALPPSPRGRSATPGASNSIFPARLRSALAMTIRCSTSSSACGTRPTVSPLRPTAAAVRGA